MFRKKQETRRARWKTVNREELSAILADELFCQRLKRLVRQVMAQKLVRNLEGCQVSPQQLKRLRKAYDELGASILGVTKKLPALLENLDVLDLASQKGYLTKEDQRLFEIWAQIIDYFLDMVLNIKQSEKEMVDLPPRQPDLRYFKPAE